MHFFQMKKQSTPLEKDIEKKVCDWAKKQGCYVRKFTSPANRSVPDRLFILPHGTVCFIEFKRPGCKPTEAQQKEILAIQDHNGIVCWSDNATRAIEWLQNKMDTEELFA